MVDTEKIKAKVSSKTFLQEVAEKIFASGDKLEDITIIFPNRRAVLYFRKHLSDLLDKPAFPPTLITIEDFISHHSTQKVPDKLVLIYELYTTYHQIIKKHEPEGALGGIEEFYFWGEMLLR